MRASARPTVALLRHLWHVSLWSVLAGLAAALVGCGTGGTQKKELEGSRLFELAKPGTVMVQAVFKAEVRVPTPAEIADEPFETLKSQLWDRVHAGEITEDELRVQLYRRVTSEWGDFLVAGDPLRTIEATISATGSGWFVTPDGYLVTNAHVVAPGEEELRSEIASLALSDVLEDDIQHYLSLWADHIVEGLSSDDMEITKESILDFHAAHMEMGEVSKEYFAAEGVAIPGVTVTQKGHPAQIAVVGEGVPGKDVAVLKVEGKDFPSLPVGDSTSVTTGHPIYAIGYPAAATFHPWLSEQSQVEPTLTSGVVSAKKTMKGGWEVLQVDAAVTHGNSGGPVLDRNGKVIGIVTFGAVDPSSGAEVQGMNFVVPMAVVNEFLARQNIHPQESAVSRQWARALELRDAGRYAAALKELKDMDAITPGHPYVQEQISAIQKLISQRRRLSLRALMPAVVAVVVVVAAAAGFLLARRRKAPTSPPPAAQA